MANEYVWYADLKTYLGISGTGDDTLLKSICTRASRVWDRLCRREFYESLGTERFDYSEPYRLRLDLDLLEVTTLTNGDGNTISASGFFLYPTRSYPKRWIELDRSGGTIFTYSATWQRCIQVLAKWGYHSDYSNAWVSSGDTVQSDPLAAGGTTLAVTAGTNFKVQQMLQIGSEQLYVSAISTNNLTVVRAQNGTTDAAHAQNAAISIWQPDHDVQHWVLRLAAWLYKQKDAPFEKSSMPSMGVVTVPADLPVDIKEAVKMYRRPHL